MSIPKLVFLVFLTLCCAVNLSYACDCEAVSKPGAADWNDADAIFTAKLLGYKLGVVGMLKFKPQKHYKGKVDPIITLYFQPGKSHTLLHAVTEFNPGDEWIVFVSKEIRRGKVYYRLKDSPLRTVCALSRPLNESHKQDPYILFLKEMVKKANGYQKMYDEEGRLLAEGQYANKIPVAEWAYYNPSRKIRISGDYAEGRREGEWSHVKERGNEDKQLIRKTIYQKGVLVEIQDYSYTGEISLKKILTDSTESRHYFWHDGMIKSKVTFNLEDNTTHSVKYSENGVVKEERFTENKRLMRQYWYDEKGKLVKEWGIEEEDGKE